MLDHQRRLQVSFAPMFVIDQLYEAWTADAVDDPKSPLYGRAPSDADAAAAGSPWIHGLTHRADKRLVARFWCHDRPVAPETRIDFEPLVETVAWRGGAAKATPRFVSAMIHGAFFETFVAGYYRQKGVTTLRFRSMRDGAVFVIDHTEPFHEETNLDPYIQRP
ncbi:MAG: hypothetical protein JNK05_35810 [Myxococcales bacterium]|nr:hypothetical protein [Myxococcales bacterium]